MRRPLCRASTPIKMPSLANCECRRGAAALAFGETALWLACPNENKVLRINPATNLVEKAIDVSAHPEALAVGGTSIWVLCEKDGMIDRIDPKTNKVSKSIELD